MELENMQVNCFGCLREKKKSTRNLQINKKLTHQLAQPKGKASNSQVGYEGSYQEFLGNLYPWIDFKCFCLDNQTNSQKVVVTHINNKNSSSNCAILNLNSSHNSTTETLPFLFDFSTQLKMNVVSYDIAKGHSTQDQKTKVLHSVVEFAETQLHYNNFIIVGFKSDCQSVLNVCRKVSGKTSAVILLSPLVDNFLGFENSTFPIFLIHGKKEKDSNYNSSIKKAKIIKNLYEWYPKNACGNDLFTKYRAKTFFKLKFFLSCMRLNNDTSLNFTSNKNFSLKFEDNFIFSHEDKFKKNHNNTSTMLRKSTTHTNYKEECPFEVQEKVLEEIEYDLEHHMFSNSIENW